MLITQQQLSALLSWHYKHPLPECDAVFPWLHGVHAQNHTQREFLSSLREFTSVERNQFSQLEHQLIPAAARGLLPVRSGPLGVGFHPQSAVLKGSVEPSEILCALDVSKADLMKLLRCILEELRVDDKEVLTMLFDDCVKMGLLPLFRNLDPQRGISLRNFHIQVVKMAQISDLVVYCFNKHMDGCSCTPVARLLYYAQLKHSIDHPELVDAMYQTLLLEDCELEWFKQGKFLAQDKIPTSDSLRTKGHCLSQLEVQLLSNWECNYLLREKTEISKMSSATRIHDNVWLGNTMDFETHKNMGFNKRNERHVNLQYIDPGNSTVGLDRKQLMQHGEELSVNPPGADWSLFVNCTDGSGFPLLSTVDYLIEEDDEPTLKTNLRFPPSGSLGIGDCNDNDIRTLVNLCKLLYIRSNEGKPSLIYCTDGYTESSLLALCFMIYATGKTLSDSAVRLHKEGRPFFLFPTDVQLISRLQPILQRFSPANRDVGTQPEELDGDMIYKELFMSRDSSWFTQVGGSLPSRILQHLYLGSLTHANSFELLKELGIEYIVAVGESLTWLDDESGLHRESINPNISVISGFQHAPVVKLMCVSNVQDDGIDMLTHNLSDILDFIEEAHSSNAKVLVHCRVGVSRSATVCIAEVMRRLDINLIRAYIFVRVRRLNIIIQPNLRFMYELVKWEESLRLSRRMKTIVDSAEERMSKRLSTSSMASDLTDLSSICSPVRHAIGNDAVATDDELEHSFMEEPEEWLRDVDWHILCREIDALNKAYIRF